MKALLIAVLAISLAYCSPSVVSSYSFKTDFECFMSMEGVTGSQLRVCFADYYWRHTKPIIKSYLTLKSIQMWDYIHYKVEQIGQSFPYTANDFYTLVMGMYVSAFLKYSGLQGTPYAS